MGLETLETLKLNQHQEINFRIDPKYILQTLKQSRDGCFLKHQKRYVPTWKIWGLPVGSSQTQGPPQAAKATENSNTQQQRECFDWSLFYQPGTSGSGPWLQSMSIPIFWGRKHREITQNKERRYFIPSKSPKSQLVIISSDPFPWPINQPRSHHPTASFFFRHCHRCYRTATLHVAMLPTSAKWATLALSMVVLCCRASM